MWARTTPVLPSPNSRPSSSTPSEDSNETVREPEASTFSSPSPHAGSTAASAITTQIGRTRVRAVAITLA